MRVHLFNQRYHMPNFVIILYSFFWVITRRLNFMCRRFGTLFHFHRLCAQEDGSDRVPKRRHFKFRRRGIAQKN